MAGLLWWERSLLQMEMVLLLHRWRGNPDACCAVLTRAAAVQERLLLGSRHGTWMTGFDVMMIFIREVGSG